MRLNLEPGLNWVDQVRYHISKKVWKFYVRGHSNNTRHYNLFDDPPSLPPPRDMLHILLSVDYDFE